MAVLHNITPGQVLKTYYGYDSFRPQQEDIIRNVVSGADTLVLMPTGGGKSVCFQVPAMMMEGTAIVVSPLISLMKDQVETLCVNGIPAAALNSNNDDVTNRAIMGRMVRGELKLLYISPERLLLDIDWISSQQVSMIAIDEAHCISQWGHDFRPEYTQLAVLRERFPNIPIIALTATADKLTKTDIVKQLRLRDPKMFVSSFDRPNLSLDVMTGCAKREKMGVIMDMVRKHRGESGIIYCMSRKTTESLARELIAMGVSAQAYHAGLSMQERDRVQENFINDRTQVICATVAFGMGIDKSDVRFVVHYNLPKSIESFYQEIGRAGRDGMPSETLLFYNLQDMITLQKFVDESAQKEINQEKLNRMKEYAEAKVCRRRILLNYFGEASDGGCDNCDVCMNPPKMFDGSIIVQKALSAIVRTAQQVGFRILVDILRGASNYEVISRGYDKIKTYGAGRDISGRDWHNYVLQMLQMGFVEIAYNEDRHLKVTPLGWDVIRGKRVQLAVPVYDDYRVKKAAPVPAATLALQAAIEASKRPTGGYDGALFEKLRKLRLRLSQERGIPPYIIFSDKTLHALATEKPTTKEAFAGIWGVGQNKVAMFGDTFVRVIKEYLK